MPLDNAIMTKPACRTCLETWIKCQTPMLRCKLHARTQEVRNVRCSTVGLHHLRFWYLSACTIIHGHSFSNFHWSSLQSMNVLNIGNFYLHTAFMQWNVQNDSGIAQQWLHGRNFCEVFVPHDCSCSSSSFSLAVWHAFAFVYTYEWYDRPCV